ncbi:beta-(1,2)-xylosyltransferase-like isoform X2 [Acanthaster planci]|uniref:EGF domain-specific O-linked N-acetylglucosamine transferase n=1 Tax=Acanthaster planci TaxID=133434 RepID=A0A8B7ZT94_ACAPL|nr:beta-(1,2)-xylosyltransferase-like isoform X2 [Acanthaster planci]
MAELPSATRAYCQPKEPAVYCVICGFVLLTIKDLKCEEAHYLSLSVTGDSHEFTMRLKLLTSRRNISALMVIIVMQVSLTCVWLAFNGNGSGSDLDRNESDQNRQQNDKPNSINPEPEAPNTRHSPRNTDKSSSKSEENRKDSRGEALHGQKTSSGRSTRGQPMAAPAKPDKHSVRRIQAHQSKFLLRMISSVVTYCDGDVEFYQNMTALMRNVIVDPAKAHTKAKGGEKVKDVLLQHESAEFYHHEKGLIHIENCSNIPAPHIFRFGHMSPEIDQLSNAVKISKDPYKNQGETILEYDSDFVILLTRFEYANVYWTVIDLYNAFLMMQLYNRTFHNTDLWIFDAHPDTSLEGLFTGTFRRVFRLTEIQGKTRFRNLLPCFSRGRTPILLKVLRPLTLAGKFRHDVLSALGVPVKSNKDRERRCWEKRLDILFIWRHNYVGHPRNPKGIVSRKISNEGELLQSTRKHFPNYTVQGEQLDKLPMRRQLQLIGNADIMVGMHGAAFGFSVFMQEGAGILEMWPRGLQGNWHMEYLAKRSSLYYQSWQNSDPASENTAEKSTKVSPVAVNSKLEALSMSICSKYKEKATL